MKERRVVHAGKVYAYEILIVKPQVKKLFGRLRFWWDGAFKKMDLENVNCNYLVENKVEWQAFVKTTNLLVL